MSNPQPSGQGGQSGSSPTQGGRADTGPSEQDYKIGQRYLSCHRDTNEATAVCGACGIPLCGDHVNETTDPLYSTFTRSRRPLLIGLGLLLVVPLAWFTLDPVSFLEGEDISVPNGLGTTAVHSSVILGFGFLFLLWGQGANRNTSARLLERQSPVRTLCEDCFADTSFHRLTTLALLGVGGVVVLLGGYLAVTGESLPPLRISALGLAVIIVRHDATLYIGKLLE